MVCGTRVENPRVLRHIKRRIEVLTVIAREQVPKGDLMVDSIQDFIRSISARYACISKVRSLVLSEAAMLQMWKHRQF